MRLSLPEDGIADGDVVLHVTTEDHMHPSREYDAVIVGGGPAGLSAALVLGVLAGACWLSTTAGRRTRSTRRRRPARTEPRRSAAPRETGREQLARHPTVEVCNDEVAGIDRRGAGFLVDLERRGEVRAHAVVFAHGLRYDPPSLAGIDELGAARSSIAPSATAGRSATFPSRCTAAGRGGALGARAGELER